MEKFVRMALLLDAYGPLLTEKQRRTADLYYGEDLSLREIADHLGVSRAAVHDALGRVEASLEEYENALGLVEKGMRRKAMLDELAVVLDELGGMTQACGGVATQLDRAKEIVKRLRDMG